MTTFALLDLMIRGGSLSLLALWMLDLLRDHRAQLAARGGTVGIEYMDAPVSGGVAGAQRGTLAVMAAGSADGFARVKPLLERFAKTVFHVGPAGTGSLAKLVNNQIFLCTSVLIQEGFVLAAKAGMDANALKQILDVSSAGIFTRKAGFMLSRDFDQALFKLAIAQKDVGVALASAAALGVDMPATIAAHTVYAAASRGGLATISFLRR
ncbi:MAG: NAD(P)-dependent oxidoreductase [Gammaproteobacteria bacterium]|nr:NAD(P)-dependent oxidoreductase [Gammaproteobacteria bacterium]